MPWEIYLLLILLILSVFLSLYIFINIVFLKTKKFAQLNTWQFPMLLAILFDVVFYEYAKL